MRVCPGRKVGISANTSSLVVSHWKSSLSWLIVGGKKNEEQGERYDAHSLLLWWRGAKYEKPSRKAKMEATITPPVTYDQVVAGQVVWEDDVMRSGRWRRLFEADMSKETSG